MQTQVTRPIYNATDINPHKRRWTVLIQVIQRNNPRDSRSKDSLIKYRTYLVTDMQGIRIGMVTYAADIPFFDATLVPFNAYVRKAKPGYEVSDYPYTWTLNNSTIVEPIMDPEPYPLPCNFEFTPFSEFASFAERGTCIGNYWGFVLSCLAICIYLHLWSFPTTIRALVVKAFPWKIVNDGLEAKDYVVVDNENTPILMRTWRNSGSEVALDLGYTLPEPLFIIATNVRVTAYHGLSLTTRYSTVCLQDPPIQEDIPIKSWYMANTSAVNEKLSQETYRDVSTLVKLPSPEVILSINHVINSISELGTTWIKGAIKLVPNQHKFWYTCCSNCNKSIHGDVGWSIWCEACKENNHIELRYNFEVSMEDGTSIICVTLYASDAQKLLPFTISELEEETSQGMNVEQKIRTAIGGRQIVCFVKHFDKLVKGTLIRKYPVIIMFQHSEVFGTAAPNVMNSAPTSPNTAANEDIQPIVDKAIDSPVEKEFFSPNTKRTLEEIVSACDMPPPQTSNTKREIVFDCGSAITASSDSQLSASESTSTTPMEPKAGATKAGLKKQRTKAKNN